MLSTNTLSGRGKIVNYIKKSDGSYEITWGKASFVITQEIINDFFTNFFTVKNNWYKLGASVEPVIEDGFGYYLYIKNTGLSPKHASAVAAVMVNERLLEYRGTKPIELRRVV